ncbi:hypothetical protein D6D06_00857 [Aureobasidium pullulans]|nr:hypothetical protein D6D06_00857 [Aureobasidium pullulans]THX69287.1 hypothetical protein D6D05_09075 [Aureobasidium pullulans]THZ06328.1 hypothetical protein D6C95_02455 [Aureobasidium pullulans]TIA19683.1 hypothetical protein D6C80_02784 [Aureobasidium pullulans]
MGVIKTLSKLTAYGTVAGAGGWALYTRKSSFVPMSSNDYIYNTTFFARNNPDQNPTMSDLCVRKVPLSQIKPEYLEKEGKLVEKFCAGVWGGLGYAYQRQYLEKKYRDADTESQLWDTKSLQESDYSVGTQITDHFEVLTKTPESIIVRCGDSPRKMEVRPSDGLFEMRAEIKEAEGVAEFQLKSVFYQGLGKATGKPMPPHIEFLHRQYTKLWMETAISNVTR